MAIHIKDDLGGGGKTKKNQTPQSNSKKPKDKDPYEAYFEAEIARRDAELEILKRRIEKLKQFGKGLMSFLTDMTQVADYLNKGYIGGASDMLNGNISNGFKSVNQVIEDLNEEIVKTTEKINQNSGTEKVEPKIIPKVSEPKMQLHAYETERKLYYDSDILNNEVTRAYEASRKRLDDICAIVNDIPQVDGCKDIKQDVEKTEEASGFFDKIGEWIGNFTDSILGADGKARNEEESISQKSNRTLEEIQAAALAAGKGTIGGTFLQSEANDSYVPESLKDDMLGESAATKAIKDAIKTGNGTIGGAFLQSEMDENYWPEDLEADVKDIMVQNNKPTYKPLTDAQKEAYVNKTNEILGIESVPEQTPWKTEEPNNEEKEQSDFGKDITYNPTDEKTTNGMYVNGYKAYIPDTVGTDNPPRTIIIDFHGKGGGGLTYDKIAENGLVGAIQNSDLAKPNAYILTPRVNSATTNKDSPWVANTSAEEMAKILDEFLAEQGLKREDVNIVFAGNSSGGQASLYMATKLPDYCDGVIAMDAVYFNGYDESIPKLVDEGKPIYAYGGSRSSGGSQASNTEGPNGFHQKMNPIIEGVVGNMTYIDSSHGDMPTNVYNIDNNHNGISDMLEKFDFISANEGEVTKSNNQREPQETVPPTTEQQEEIDNMSEAELEKLIVNIAKQLGIDTQGKTIDDLLKRIADIYNVPLTEEADALPIPLYNQMDYRETKYGNHGDTIGDNGCGIAAYAMVLSYFFDREILPSDLVVRDEDEIDEFHKNYNRHNSPGQGSNPGLFLNTAEEDWGISVEQCNWEAAWNEGKLEQALRNGQPVIARVNAISPFTTGGHFIVLTGITEDGKVLVNDPNGFNYNSNRVVKEEGKLKDLLAGEGFNLDDFRDWGQPFYIFEKKETGNITSEVERPVSSVLGDITDKIQRSESHIPLTETQKDAYENKTNELLGIDKPEQQEEKKGFWDTLFGWAGEETVLDGLASNPDIPSTVPKIELEEEDEEEEEEKEPEQNPWKPAPEQNPEINNEQNNTEDTEEDYEMPYYNQKEIDYRINGYSMVTGGCGMCSYAMVLSYLRGEEIRPERLADKYYGPYYSKGTSARTFEETSKRDWDISVTAVSTYYGYSTSNQIMDALENNQPIIALVNDGGHYIVLTGLTEDGQIKVKDPNGNEPVEIFTQKEIFGDIDNYFYIFESKEDVSSRPQKDLDEILTEEPKGTYGE